MKTQGLTQKLDFSQSLLVTLWPLNGDGLPREGGMGGRKITSIHRLRGCAIILGTSFRVLPDFWISFCLNPGFLGIIFL